ncbi:hypothetical protein RFI_11337 [Reticulomyxa filosa]|uniref:Sodium/calcium exchanger membrane region domain-containing protein n=1 Tax=Reticulomyxa filosa TaxID=46433 RepID=X6NIJ4_RETFI|nr:hypothetical protein RFI_11337 [Reticulomyxa filosa]|eukprot:ETO25801.1 hypothetical protein RFI_11337 [Reticulomyxa filosa]
MRCGIIAAITNGLFASLRLNKWYTEYEHNIVCKGNVITSIIIIVPTRWGSSFDALSIRLLGHVVAITNFSHRRFFLFFKSPLTIANISILKGLCTISVVLDEKIFINEGRWIDKEKNSFVYLCLRFLITQRQPQREQKGEIFLFGFPSGEEENGVGQFFLMVCYGFILFKAAVIIGDSCEKLLLLYGPKKSHTKAKKKKTTKKKGVIGGLVIPILGAIPDGAIVLVSGLGADAQNQVAVGVGTLAGSTILLLTIPWSVGVILGCRDYDEKTGKAASYDTTHKPKHENGITLFRSCITTYPNIPFSAKIMMVVATSYFIVGYNLCKLNSINHYTYFFFFFLRKMKLNT